MLLFTLVETIIDFHFPLHSGSENDNLESTSWISRAEVHLAAVQRMCPWADKENRNIQILSHKSNPTALGSVPFLLLYFFFFFKPWNLFWVGTRVCFRRGLPHVTTSLMHLKAYCKELRRDIFYRIVVPARPCISSCSLRSPGLKAQGICLKMTICLLVCLFFFVSILFMYFCILFSANEWHQYWLYMVWKKNDIIHNRHWVNVQKND